MDTHGIGIFIQSLIRNYIMYVLLCYHICGHALFPHSDTVIDVTSKVFFRSLPPEFVTYSIFLATFIICAFSILLSSNLPRLHPSLLVDFFSHVCILIQAFLSEKFRQSWIFIESYKLVSSNVVIQHLWLFKHPTVLMAIDMPSQT